MPSDVRVGQQRWWVKPDWRDPHTVLRIGTWPRDGVLIKYGDKTTDWWPLDEYASETEEVASDGQVT